MRCNGEVPQRRSRAAGGFTLVEILVVIVIIFVISAVTLPGVIAALSHRQVSEAARILQGTLVGARDSAIHENTPSGIRLLPDPTFLTRVTNPSSPLYGQIDPTQPLAANRIIPLQSPPNYNDGLVTVGPPPYPFNIP